MFSNFGILDSIKCLTISFADNDIGKNPEIFKILSNRLTLMPNVVILFLVMENNIMGENIENMKYLNEFIKKFPKL